MAVQKSEESQDSKKNNEVNREEEILKQLKQAQDEIAALKKNQISPSSNGISADQLERILSVVTAKKEEELDLHAGIVAEKIPLEDIDPHGVVFYAPLAGYVISGDTKNGIPIKLPWGKKSIFFEHMHTKIIKTGKYDEVAPLSKYHSSSKKEIEWLRNHSMCNVLFYESSPSMKVREASTAARLADILAGIKDLDLHEIVKRCHAEGVGVNDSIEDMRVGLAYKTLEKELSKDKELAKTRLENTEKASKLLNK